jgi:hypothetical protein
MSIRATGAFRDIGLSGTFISGLGPGVFGAALASVIVDGGGHCRTTSTFCMSAFSSTMLSIVAASPRVSIPGPSNRSPRRSLASETGKLRWDRRHPFRNLADAVRRRR